MPFQTTFSPGVGRQWFVGGLSVMQSDRGWTDIDKQTSLGDMAWPKPTSTWVGFGADDEIIGGSLPAVQSELCFEDAWLGGSSLRLKIKSTETLTEESFQCFQVPINSLALSPHTSYIAHLTYKVLSPLDIDLDVGLSVKILSDVSVAKEVRMLDLEESLLEAALNTSTWSRASIKFSVPADYTGDFLASIGVQLGFMTPEGSPNYSIDILIGQICVYQAPSQGISTPDPRILYAEYEPTSSTLNWGTGSSLVPPAPINIGTLFPDDPTPVWLLDQSPNWFPSFLYYNIYWQLPREDGTYEDDTKATFYGTTSLQDGTSFLIVREAIGCPAGKKARFHVQGVTDRGTILEVGKCGNVDVAI